MMSSSTAYQRAEMPTGTSAVLETRTLENSNANLLKVLSEGQAVLDVGCGTGAITVGMVSHVGPTGVVIGIDRSAELIAVAQKYKDQQVNLQFEVGDIMSYETTRLFDVVSITRTLQWMAHPAEVLERLTKLLRPGGTLCILDYNHDFIEWEPAPPASMQHFYALFLKWRQEAGMDNHIGSNAESLLVHLGAKTIETADYSENRQKGMDDFESHLSIWQKVAETRGHQLVRDGYLREQERIAAVTEYGEWMKGAQSMKLDLRATHATFSF